jgi:acyl transferase domain-containing protein
MGRGIRELVSACLAGVVSLEDALKLGGMSKFRAAVSAAGLTGASMNMVLMSTGAKAADTLDAAFWLGQAGGAVRFAKAVQAAVAMGSTTFVEVGPGVSLLGQLQAAVADVPDTLLMVAMDAFSGDVMGAVSALHCRGVEIRWPEVYALPCVRARLPLYPFQKKRFWVGMVKGEAVTGQAQAGLRDPSLIASLLHDVVWETCELPRPDRLDLAGSFLAVVQRGQRSERLLESLQQAGLRNAQQVGVQTVPVHLNQAPLLASPSPSRWSTRPATAASSTWMGSRARRPSSASCCTRTARTWWPCATRATGATCPACAPRPPCPAPPSRRRRPGGTWSLAA